VCTLRFCSSFGVAGVGGDEGDAARASSSRISDAHAAYRSERPNASSSVCMRLLGGRAKACVQGMLVILGDDVLDEMMRGPQKLASPCRLAGGACVAA
jgi:hypothetical protein